MEVKLTKKEAQILDKVLSRGGDLAEVPMADLRTADKMVTRAHNSIDKTRKALEDLLVKYTDSSKNYDSVDLLLSRLVTAEMEVAHAVEDIRYAKKLAGKRR
ncbi:MAG: hypothetical protein OXI90_05760 [Gammaproteobacteria bacterium]|nr:hypothetical protein [Gammaproteobacteria bacterium]